MAYEVLFYAGRFQILVETEAILEFLVTGLDQGLLVYLLSFAVDLNELSSFGVDVTSKISDWGKKAREHVRKFQKLELKNNARALSIIGMLRLFMADISSECSLARLAKEYGYEVKLGKHPDLTVDGRSVEVKRTRDKFFMNGNDHLQPLVDLSNPSEKGLRQNADIVSIQVFSRSISVLSVQPRLSSTSCS